MKEFIDSYLNLLNTDFQGLNLTRISDYDEFRVKQYEDSVLPLEKSKFFKKHLIEMGVLLDIGFGGGFPILPISNELREIKAIGFEARGKKSKAVNSIAESLCLNVKTYHERIENIRIDMPCVITFKAVSRIRQCLDFLNVDSKDVFMYFYKGPDLFTSEGEDLGLDNKKYEVFESINFKLEDGSERNFIGIRSKNVPRGTAKKNKKHHKNLVRLSSFL